MFKYYNRQLSFWWLWGGGGGTNPHIYRCCEASWVNSLWWICLECCMPLHRLKPMSWEISFFCKNCNRVFFCLLRIKQPQLRILIGQIQSYLGHKVCIVGIYILPWAQIWFHYRQKPANIGVKQSHWGKVRRMNTMVM